MSAGDTIQQIVSRLNFVSTESGIPTGSIAKLLAVTKAGMTPLYTVGTLPCHLVRYTPSPWIIRMPYSMTGMCCLSIPFRWSSSSTVHSTEVKYKGYGCEIGVCPLTAE
eukprot:Blabericola_migrator_1__729@NODE_1181_length_5200_cov_79_295928_g803_i0_p5_GENE_NODE_1181_length_5200_cov_79_295928_g803_i0NODE_1181_length_5200_cov_79_295928_g803_i0_p5_ORF_typecomplete_len109_score7_59_NODE_1181_length_5200_cov_79_295928_g803_i042524578